jgi:hypothetical protein
VNTRAAAAAATPTSKFTNGFAASKNVRDSKVATGTGVSSPYETTIEGLSFRITDGGKKLERIKSRVKTMMHWVGYT